MFKLYYFFKFNRSFIINGLPQAEQNLILQLYVFLHFKQTYLTISVFLHFI